MTTDFGCSFGPEGCSYVYRGHVPLRLRLIGLFSVLVLIVAGAAVAVTWPCGTSRHNRRLVVRPPPARQRAEPALLVSPWSTRRPGSAGYLLTGDEAFLEPYRDGGGGLHRPTLAELREDFAGDPG